MIALRRTDPATAERYRLRAGAALRSVGKPARVARALGCSERYVQMLCSGDRPNALATTAQIIGALSRAGLPTASLIAYLKSESVGAVMSMSEDALVANLRALVLAETEAEGKLNPLQVSLRPDDPDQLAEIERLALEQAARLEELAATARELRRKIERRQGTNGRNGRAGR